MARLPCLERDQEQKRRARGLVDNRPVAHPPHSRLQNGQPDKERHRSQLAAQLVLAREVRLRLLCELGSWVLVVGVLAEARLG
jgi:hypothetical protein